ncbi:hypothetical protein MPOCJGCO_4755 [Methylobacterium trifolii]|uniref:Uncharacterized protein n=1 Tax=Methylobacterium trifolii TaxID=1003092 RepID=A0ABQ4U6X7_9HYPH|nr:hypothetical protein MPOCJGCO_4755 [Methylobacterium trifolii]
MVAAVPHRPFDHARTVLQDDVVGAVAVEVADGTDGVAGGPIGDVVAGLVLAVAHDPVDDGAAVLEQDVGCTVAVKVTRAAHREAGGAIRDQGVVGNSRVADRPVAHGAARLQQKVRRAVPVQVVGDGPGEVHGPVGETQALDRGQRVGEAGGRHRVGAVAGAGDRGRRAGDVEGRGVDARAAVDRVVAAVAGQRVVGTVAGEPVVARAADGGLDHGALGDRDVVGQAARAAEGARGQVHGGALRETGQVEGVVGALVVERHHRRGVVAEIVQAAQETGDVRIEPEHLPAGELRLAGGRRPVELLDRQDVALHHRVGRRAVVTVRRHAPVGAGDRVASAVLGGAGVAPVDVGHERPHPLVVGAVLLRRRIDVAVVGTLVPEAEQVADLVDDGGLAVAAHRVEVAGKVEAGAAGVDRDPGLVRMAAEGGAAGGRGRAGLVGAAVAAALEQDVGGRARAGCGERDVGDRRPHREGAQDRGLLGRREGRSAIEEIADGRAGARGRGTPLVGGATGRSPVGGARRRPVRVQRVHVGDFLREGRADGACVVSGRGRGGLRTRQDRIGADHPAVIVRLGDEIAGAVVPAACAHVPSLHRRDRARANSRHMPTIRSAPCDMTCRT